MPVYNRQDFVSDTLWLIESQHAKSIEVIIADHNSNEYCGRALLKSWLNDSLRDSVDIALT